MAKNEIVKAENYQLVAITGELAEAVSEEMDGLGALQFDRVNIPSGGGIAFELPGEDNEPIAATAIVGVILDHHPVNAYWKAEFTGENIAPDCSSIDGKSGVVLETGEIRDCASCPHNQFGSDGKRSKACKNMHRVYILQEKNPVPILLTLPPTSLKGLRDYIGKKIVLKGLRCYQAITKVTLKKETNADGINYSRAVFAYQDRLTPDQEKAAEAMREMVRSLRNTVTVGGDDAAAPSSSGSGQAPAPDPVEAAGDEFINIPENIDETLPFK